MKTLSIKTQIHKFDSVADFFNAFQIGKGDLVFTHEFIHQPLLAPLLNVAEVLLFEDYGAGEPSSTIVDKILHDVKKTDYKRIIAIGGGSVIDISKLLVFKNAQKTTDIFDKKIPLQKGSKLVIVPTTCGTGSEVTNLSIVEIVEKKTKLGFASDDICADDAVLIPALVKTLPYPFFLYSSVDALIHACESFVSPNSNAYTELFAVSSIERIIGGYRAIRRDGPDARLGMMESFLIASNFAGIAFGNTGVGAVHALSYPVGGNYHVPHGEVNYRFFMQIFKAYQNKKPYGKIQLLQKTIAEVFETDEASAFDAMEELLGAIIGNKKLCEYGMKEQEIEGFADSVIDNQQRLLKNNYTALLRDEIRDIYQALY